MAGEKIDALKVFTADQATKLIEAGTVDKGILTIKVMGNVKGAIDYAPMDRLLSFAGLDPKRVFQSTAFENSSAGRIVNVPEFNGGGVIFEYELQLRLSELERVQRLGLTAGPRQAVAANRQS